MNDVGGGKDYGCGKGYGKMQSPHNGFYKPSDAVTDRFPKVAQKLTSLRDNLGRDASKCYMALQMALQRHSTPQGSRPNFEKDFHESLSVAFPNALDIIAKQIGSWNQWEVTVDNGPTMSCSVRLEVLSDDPQVVQDIKSKARIVKETLLEDNSKWKRTLQPETGAFNFERLSQFERECATRANAAYDPEYERGKGGKQSTKWIPKDGEKGGRGGHGDEMSQILGQRVFATFQCSGCGNSWTSYHARLRPDGETIMGQSCAKCMGSGRAMDWRICEPNEQQHQGGERKMQGMHQVELCEACREFGNCTGVFYDPFILTTALSIVSGQYVQWKAFSADMPELLIADLGPQCSDLQVCLQPHVYVADDKRQGYNSKKEFYYDDDSNAPSYGKGSGGGREKGGGKQSSGGKNGRELWTADNPHARREAGGVKDQNLMEGFLSKADSTQAPQTRAAQNQSSGLRPPDLQRPRAPLPPSGGNPSAGAVASSSANFMEQPPKVGRAEIPDDAHGGSKARGDTASGSRPMVGADESSKSAPLAGDEAGGRPLSQAAYAAPDAMPDAPAEATVPKTKKFNKIGAAPAAVKPPAAAGATAKPSAQPGPAGPATPLLDALPPLRRAQFLQVVLRHLKASGGAEAEKFKFAEEYLSTCSGDYDKAYQHVKTLSETPQ